MFDPFKRARAKATKRIRRKSVSAVTDLWGAMLPHAPKPKSAPKKTRTPTAKTAKPSRATRKARAAPKPTIPVTAKSKATVPRGASFKSGTYDSEFGTRSYELYAPKIAKTTVAPLPLIVMLHGCGQSPKDFARGTGMNALAEEFGFFVLYPAQARQAHINRCWNWFKPSDQARDSGEPALLAGLTQKIMAEHPIDPARVYVAGLSAGASIATILARAYPDIFAAVGVHSGLAAGAAHDAATAARAMQMGATGQRHATPMPTIIFHGDADKVVNPRNGRFVALRAVEPYRSLDRTQRTGRPAGGRAFVRTTHRVGRGRAYVDHWGVVGSGHAWSGGHAAGSFTDPSGPDASREMVKFFLRHRTTKKQRESGPNPP